MFSDGGVSNEESIASPDLLQMLMLTREEILLSGEAEQLLLKNFSI